MKCLVHSTASPILGLSRTAKRIIALSVDVCLCVLATWLAFYLRLDEFVKLNNDLARPAFLSIALALPIFAVAGLYRAIFRYSGWPAIAAVGRAMSLYGLVYMTVIMVVGLDSTPRTVGIIQPLLLFFAVAIRTSSSFLPVLKPLSLAQSLLGGKNPSPAILFVLRS